MTYASLDDWLDEVEGFGLRVERVPEGALPWIRVAWNLAYARGLSDGVAKGREDAVIEWQE